MAVGRISGPLLKSNLLRNGVDLAFETDLLYLDVNNGRIGVNTSTPTHDLTVAGTFRTTNIDVPGTLNVASFTFASNTISSSSSTINFAPSGGQAVVYNSRIQVGSFDIRNNTLSMTGTNTSLEVTPTGTGTVNFNSNVNVFGNLHATGNITADGNITLGNASNDTVTFSGVVGSNIVPSQASTFSLGSSSFRWSNVYVDTAHISTFATGTLTLNDFQTSQLDIANNTISTLSANTDIHFVTTGTGGVRLGNVKFRDNEITNVVSGAVTTFTQTGTGYIKFAGSNGVVIPTGDTALTRPSAMNAEIGMIRYNTDRQLVELWDGLGWGRITGNEGGVSFYEANEIGLFSALIVG